MAKTESTAVNELISIAQTQTPLIDRHEDLMFKVPSREVEKRARMTSPVSTINELAPLPRRSGSGTAESPAVRVSTSHPSRAMSIPPIPQSNPAIARPSSNSNPSLPPPPSSPRIPLPTSSSARIPVPASAIATPTLPPLPTTLLRSDVDPRATKPSLPPPVRSSDRIPRAMTNRGMDAQGTPAPERFSPNTTAPLSMPVAAPFEPKSGRVNPLAATQRSSGVPVLLSPEMTSNAAWFDHNAIADELEPKRTHTEPVPTATANTVALVGKLAVPMVGLVIVGIFVGGFVAFNGEGGKPHHATPVTRTDAPAPQQVVAPAPARVEIAAPAQVAQPVAAQAVAVAAAPVAAAPVAAPTPAPVAAPVAAPAVQQSVAAPVATHGKPVLVDVRIDSQPMGATVMLVDRGKTSFLGTTPIAASVDPSRRYDLIFTLDNRPTQIEHLDPKLTKRVAVVLGKSKTATPPAAPAIAQPAAPHIEQKPVTAPVVAAAPPPAPKHVEPAPVAPAPAKAEPKHVEPAEAAAPAEPAHKAAVETGSGTLMISSKPPCQIIVDGNPTGLTTPQRAMVLPAGAHKITLVGASDATVTKTVSVHIVGGKPTKVIQDLTK